MHTSSRTAVLIPHYNNLQGLYKSVKSISHANGIDVLIIDDGSHDSLRPDIEHLRSISKPKVRITVKYLPTNTGITAALNLGLNLILSENRHQYIARIDCGDTCVLNRFNLQENFLDENKDVSLVGSWVKWFHDSSNKEAFTYRPPSENKKIRRKMSIRCNLIHPSVMYRVSVVKKVGVYPLKFDAAEDYAYFFEMAKHGKLANIPKVLTSSEHTDNGISAKSRKIQNRNKLKIALKYGKKDFYLLYGIFFNTALIFSPDWLVFKIKSKISKYQLRW